MEQEQTYTPSDERSLDELRRDINLKAKKLFLRLSNAEKISLAILGISFVVFEALNLKYKWIATDLLSLCAVLLVLSLVIYIFYTINKRLYSAMEQAGDAKQHLKATKKLILIQKWESVISFVLGFLLMDVIIRGKINFEPTLFIYLSAGLIGCAIGTFINPPRTFLNRKLWDFYDDVEELSMNVE